MKDIKLMISGLLCLLAYYALRGAKRVDELPYLEMMGRLKKDLKKK